MNTGNTYYFIDDFNKICKCEKGMKSDESIVLETYELVDDVNRLMEENEQLKKDVGYWKQVASQYSNELNALEHCRKYKTECKDIHWSSDVE